MIVVEAWMTAAPEHVSAFAEAARELVLTTQDEPDFQAYTCSQDLGTPGRFVFVEHWSDTAALGRHARTAHFQAFAELTGPWLTERRVLIHDVSGTNQV